MRMRKQNSSNQEGAGEQGDGARSGFPSLNQFSLHSTFFGLPGAEGGVGRGGVENHRERAGRRGG